MDLLNEAKARASQFSRRRLSSGIDAVIRHIEAAERYLLRGRAEHEDDFYNDVIYRTNQAFEGALKEAFAVLTEKSAEKKSAYAIEQHLLDQNVLAPRVLELFTNYRQNWRNPSTHDHTLFFGEQEALLAIVSVSAFVNILLDQMIESAAARAEKEALEQAHRDIAEALGQFQDLELIEKVTAVLRFFASDISQESLSTWSEAEFIGRVTAYLQNADPGVEVLREYTAAGGTTLRPDLLLQKGDEKVIVEMKRSRNPTPAMINSGKGQLLDYLAVGRVEAGIIFFVPEHAGDPMRVERVPLEDAERTLQLHIIMPTLAG